VGKNYSELDHQPYTPGGESNRRKFLHNKKMPYLFGCGV
jgi:hypothetical protein